MKELAIDEEGYKPKVIHGSAYKHLKKLTGEDILPQKHNAIDFNVSPSKLGHNMATDNKMVSPDMYNF